MSSDDKETLLSELYYNPEVAGSFGGATRLYEQAVKLNPLISKEDVMSWLEGEESYTLFRQAKRKFLRLPILVNRLDEQWQADLMDMSWISNKNRGIKFLLVVVDLLSRYAWVRPLKDKFASTIKNALNDIFSASKRKPEKLQTDQGKEFNNSIVKNFLNTNGVRYFTSTDDVIKCAIVERLNRTLRSRIYRFMFYNDDKKYLKSLQDIVAGYNNSFHRIIKMAPADVNANNERIVLRNIKKTHVKIKSYPIPFKVEDKVRITKWKGKFTKGAMPNFTEEIFTISKVKKTPQGYIYRLKDFDGEQITSVFYQNELILVKTPKRYKIDRILDTQIDPVTNEKWYLVKWTGYPDKFNSWTRDVDKP